MANTLRKSDELAAERIHLFCNKNINQTNNLLFAEQFPEDIWSKMADKKIIGIGIPKNSQGSGGDWATLSAAGRAFAKTGRSLGFAMGFMIHSIICRYCIMGMGNKEQQQTFLPKLLKGEIASLAVSEAETGANPKYIKTKAELIDGNYVLNGEKAYITNGPLAHIFIVFAETCPGSQKKEFSAFIVPQKTPGVLVQKPMNLPFLKPIPHCGIVLKNCVVPSSNLIGKKGSAYEDLVKPFREIEDTLMMGPVSGTMLCLNEAIFSKIRVKKLETNDDILEKLGRLISIADSAGIMASQLAAMLSRQLNENSTREFMSLLFQGRGMNHNYVSTAAEIIKTLGLSKDKIIRSLHGDLSFISRIAENPMKIKIRKVAADVIKTG